MNSRNHFMGLGNLDSRGTDFANYNLANKKELIKKQKKNLQYLGTLWSNNSQKEP